MSQKKSSSFLGLLYIVYCHNNKEVANARAQYGFLGLISLITLAYAQWESKDISGYDSLRTEDK